MGFELVHNFIGSRIVAYVPGLLPYMDNKVSLQQYVTGAELATALINECSWFIHVMPDIATLRANARRMTDLAKAIEAVQRPEEFYAQTGLYEFQYTKQDPALGLTVEQIGLLHAGTELPFLTADRLQFLPASGPWSLVIQGAVRPRSSRQLVVFGRTDAALSQRQDTSELSMPPKTSSFRWCP
ncbi:hypothetical protein SAMN05216328_119123 [Ensifer sp. YR511]|nr:hypothetical protein SAMN05216328_119123 [Ensifer sp. YR511]